MNTIELFTSHVLDHLGKIVHHDEENKNRDPYLIKELQLHLLYGDSSEVYKALQLMKEPHIPLHEAATSYTGFVNKADFIYGKPLNSDPKFFDLSKETHYLALACEGLVLLHEKILARPNKFLSSYQRTKIEQAVIQTGYLRTSSVEKSQSKVYEEFVDQIGFRPIFKQFVNLFPTSKELFEAVEPALMSPSPCNNYKYLETTNS